MSIPADTIPTACQTLITPVYKRLQMLISGTGASIDLEDMRANVQYAGGYHEEHPLVHNFWKVRTDVLSSSWQSLGNWSA